MVITDDITGISLTIIEGVRARAALKILRIGLRLRVPLSGFLGRALYTFPE